MNEPKNAPEKESEMENAIQLTPRTFQLKRCYAYGEAPFSARTLITGSGGAVVSKLIPLSHSLSLSVLHMQRGRTQEQPVIE